MHVVSNIHPVHVAVAEYEERKDILFIGGFEHPPNVDAVLWFCREIWPLVTSKLPGIKFHIIGSKTPREILDLQSDQIIVHGFVKDVAPHFASCRLSIAPLRYGAGVKGKVNQSMAYGVPCVLTPAAAEGMYLKHGRDALILETPEAFANSMIKIYQDCELWKRLSDDGIKNIKENFSFEAARRALLSALTSITPASSMAAIEVLPLRHDR